MNTPRKYTAYLATIGLLLMAGCEKDFDRINNNPNSSKQEDAIPSALFAYSVRGLAYYNYDAWYLLRQSALAAQQWCQNNYTTEDLYEFRSGVLESFFRDNYLYMNNFQQIIALNTNENTKGIMKIKDGDNSAQIAICEIMKCWVFHLMTDAFGDIPYSQALNIANTRPKYDSQKEVYDGLIAQLKASKTALEGVTGEVFTSGGDVIYNGDVGKWIKLANSLRLRLALRASNADVSYLTEAQSAIADGVFGSNDDNAQCKFIASGAPNEAPIYNAFFTSARNDFTLTYRFVELLKGNNDAEFVNPFNGLLDPRICVYTGLPPAQVVTRTGQPYGLPDEYNIEYWDNANRNGVAINLMETTPSMLSYNFPTTFLDYPTVCFMVSEVQGWDATWFENGVTASMEQWGATEGKDAYIAAVKARFAAATTPEAKKEMVITQKYIHLLTQSHEAWAEYRRTGYPKCLLEPGDTTLRNYNFSAALGGTQSIVFEPYHGETEVCTRFRYSTAEFTLNKANVEAAIARMGGNTYNTHLWWDGGK